MASTYLTRTPGTGQTSRYKGTLSVWLKRAKTDEEDFIFYGYEASANRMKITFLANGKLQINSIQAGSNNLVYETNRLFRDTSAWYHIVIGIDTTLATAGDRCRLYVNGEEETSFSTETHFSQNALHFFSENNIPVYVGSQASGNYFDGCMAHYHLIDGTQYDADDFGETDSTTGQWKIKTNPSVSYGTHGFFLFKDNNSADDQSGNNNDFTITGTLTQTEDCPSNVFATWNALQPTGATLSNGNTTGQSTNGNYISGVSTLGVTTGKYYAEFKLSAESATGESAVGVTGLVRPTSAIISQTGNFGLRNYNGITYYTSGGTASTSTSQHGGFTTSDIIGVALDLDNDRLYFSKNGGWWNGTSTWTGTTPTNYITLQTDIFDEFFFECGDAGASVNATWQANFGNGYFGTTAISSEGTNASGIGKFEYNVPTGYTALSTKGLNE
jgi:hypothetical protein